MDVFLHMRISHPRSVKLVYHGGKRVTIKIRGSLLNENVTIELDGVQAIMEEVNPRGSKDIETSRGQATATAQNS